MDPFQQINMQIRYVPKILFYYSEIIQNTSLLGIHSQQPKHDRIPLAPKDCLGKFGQTLVLKVLQAGKR